MLQKKVQKEVQKKVYRIVSKIPKGRTMTYGEIAEKAGTSPRAVARILAVNPNPIIVPCHRVIKSNGSLGGYTKKGKQRVDIKRKLLEKEGAI